MNTFPALKPVDMQETGMGEKESAADILFSSQVIYYVAPPHMWYRTRDDIPCPETSRHTSDWYPGTGMGWKESAADILFSSAGNSFYPIIYPMKMDQLAECQKYSSQVLYASFCMGSSLIE